MGLEAELFKLFSEYSSGPYGNGGSECGYFPLVEPCDKAMRTKPFAVVDQQKLIGDLGGLWQAVERARVACDDGAEGNRVASFGDAMNHP